MPVGEGRPAKGGSSGAAWGGGGIAQGGVSRTGSGVDGVAPSEWQQRRAK